MGIPRGPTSPTGGTMGSEQKRGSGSRIEYDENGKKILPEIYYVPTSRHIRRQTDYYFGGEPSDDESKGKKKNTTLIARMSRSMDLDEINDIHNKSENKVLAIEDRKTASESLTKRLNRSQSDAIELAKKRKDHTKSDSEDSSVHEEMKIDSEDEKTARKFSVQE